MAQILPELALFDLIDKLTTYLITDLNVSSQDSKTILYSILGDNKFRENLYFNKAKDLFLRSEEDPRKLRLQLYYTYEKEEIPTISITAPVDQPALDVDTIGGGENEYLDIITGKTQPYFSRNFKSTINIVITSKNVEEQVLLYNVYRALLVGFLPILNLRGFQNPSISGRDMQVDPELINSNSYVRIITLSYFYEVSVPQKKMKDLISSIKWIPNLKIQI